MKYGQRQKQSSRLLIALGPSNSILSFFLSFSLSLSIIVANKRCDTWEYYLIKYYYINR